MKIDEWTIVNMENVENVENVDSVENTLLSTLHNWKLSPQEEFVQNVLENYEYKETYIDPETWIETTKTVKADPKSLLEDIIKESNKVITQNAKWDIIPDYAARAKLKMELLKAAGIVKPKTAEAKINFLSILFWK